ncbi:unnamed protein product [Pleuronectes platessa]|uniref:Uncharacterized protein n=1 Tax=Pleuronectes platessa TaxID=8262 RepID=A0A9N7VPD1_PLEPL|nr:unnamed protein product [Pleuronectes platessa]
MHLQLRKHKRFIPALCLNPCAAPLKYATFQTQSLLVSHPCGFPPSTTEKKAGKLEMMTAGWSVWGVQWWYQLIKWATKGKGDGGVLAYRPTTSFLWGYQLEAVVDGSFTFNGDVHHYAVATNTVYVATNDMLYQLRHDLTLVQSVPQRGVLKGGAQVQFHRVSGTDFSNATFRINVLLPLVESDTLISCGVIDKECGHCEVLKLMDISSLQHSESIQVGSLDHSSASVAVLVKVEKNTYILTALRQSQNQKERTRCTLP